MEEDLKLLVTTKPLMKVPSNGAVNRETDQLMNSHWTTLMLKKKL